MSGKPFVFVLGYDGQPLMPCTGKRARLPKTKRLFGFATGDLVRAVFQKGKPTEQSLLGRVGVRTSGKFVLAVGNRPYSVSYRNCKLVQMTDGYQYGSTRYEYERAGKHILAIPAIIN